MAKQTQGGKLDYIIEIVDKLDHTVNGNGKEGLVTRVDRIEQVEISRKWLMRVLIVAIVTGIIGFIIKTVGG